MKKIKMNICCSSKANRTWLKWMNWGGRLGCHQRPERSFFIKGYQMPVCARCTGVFIGYLLSVFSLFKPKSKYLKQAAVAGSSIMLTDWSLQHFGIKKSTNKRRLVTGILGGFGIMTLWISGIKWVLSRKKES